MAYTAVAFRGAVLPRVSYAGGLVPAGRVHQPRKFHVLAYCSSQPDPNLTAKEQEGSESHGVFSKARNSISMNNQDDLKSKLKRYGLAGILSYGIFNTLYYLGTFLFVWLYVAPSPGRLGFSAAAQRLVKVLAMVWAGSQVTKLLRAAAALALAPVVDKFLNWFTRRFKFHSREQAFGFVVAACFGVALVLFLLIAGLWA